MFLLADAGPGDGGLTVIPGSHKSNHPWPDEVYPHSALATSHLVHQPAAKAGDMLIFTCEASSCTLAGGIFSPHQTLPHSKAEAQCRFAGRL